MTDVTNQIAEAEALLAKLKEEVGIPDATPGAAVAQFAATTPDVETPEEAGFASETSHELSHVEGSVADVATAVSDVTAAVEDVTSGHIVDAAAPSADLIAEIHAMVSDLHATVEGVKPIIADLVPFVEKLSQSPALKLFGA